MGLPSRIAVHARHRDGADRADDRRKAPPQQPVRRGGLAAGLILLAAWAAPAAAETLTIATFNAELTRKGPGLLLRDVLTTKDKQVEAAARVIAGRSPDVLLLTGIDWDLDLLALRAFAARVSAAGADYPHLYSARPNTGMPTGLDLDGDGRLAEADDAQGWGRFTGEGGMAVLSRLPLDDAAARDFSDVLWRDLPGNLIAEDTLAEGAAGIQRLSSTGHWDVPVILPDGGRLHLLAYSAGPPVFDGPEDRNGRRNYDETVFWLRYLDGALPDAPPKGPFVILGTVNLDPADGDGRANAISNLLSDRRVTDPEPASAGGRAAADAGQRGDPSLDTAVFAPPKGPGNLRVDYVLPSAGLKVTDSGVWWPEEAEAASDAAEASRHRLVWVTMELEDGAVASGP
jgi:Endonuclease/Exonuclease/phosphatase family